MGTELGPRSMFDDAVVVIEVPSGWMSDRLGRVFTVRVAALSWVVAHVLFIGGLQQVVAQQDFRIPVGVLVDLTVFVNAVVIHGDIPSAHHNR